MHAMKPWAWALMALWGAVFLVAFWLLTRQQLSRSVAEDADATLRAAFAGGEISQDEFERARTALLRDAQKERSS